MIEGFSSLPFEERLLGGMNRFTHFDLPRSTRVGDSRRPLRYLLHCARSCDIYFSWMYSQPVHSSMLCIHCLLGLPWCRNPSMFPSRTVSANCPALPRVMWPKYCSLSFATLPVNSLSRPNSVNIESFVRCSCHENAKHFSPAPHFKSFYSVSVRFLQSPSLHSMEYCVEFYLYPTVGTVLIHSVKPELTE